MNVPTIKHLTIPAREIKQGDRVPMDDGTTIVAQSDAYQIGGEDSEHYAFNGSNQLYQIQGDMDIAIVRIERDG